MVTLSSAPKQSDTISTLPARFWWSLLMLSRIRGMAIRPSNSPVYAFATSSASKNDPITLPRPLLHSSTNAVKYKVGNSFLIYDPSVTATNVPSEIDCFSHATPPDTYICSHSHVFPRDCNTSKNKDGAKFCVAHGAMERRCQCFPSRVGCTKHIVSCT